MHDVKAVRNSLKAVSELVCTRSKKIMELYEKRERKLKLLERLHDISCLRDAQSTVQMLLNQSDYPKAIDCIETSQEMIVSFIPFVSSEIEPMLKTDQKHLMRHFKQVLSDHTDHINEITHKLVNVIDHHTSSCLNSWELKGSMPSPAFQQICRQMQKFHNGLAGIIPNDQIKSLFETVHKGFKIHLKQQLAKMGITPHDSLTYGLVCQDYTFYVQSLHNLECCSQIQLETLNEVVYGR